MYSDLGTKYCPKRPHLMPKTAVFNSKNYVKTKKNHQQLYFRAKISKKVKFECQV